MRQRAFIPFTAFTPDGAAHGGGLDMVRNLLPIHGGKRSLQKRSDRASEASSGNPFTGLFVHIFAESRSVQFLRPDADVSVGLWVVEGGGGGDLYEAVDESAPNDADAIVAPGAPSAEAVVLRLSDVTTPGSLADHVIEWRFAVENYDGQAGGGVTSITRSGTTATVTTAAAHGLSTGDVAVHVGADQPEYNVAAIVTVTGASTYTFEVSGTPASPATGTITWEEGWKVVMELLEAGSVVDPGADPVEDIAIGGADSAATSRSLTLTSGVGGQADTISDYGDLSLRFTATVPGPVQSLRPSSDVTVGGWTDEGGASSSLFESIDEAVASDADYATSGALTLGATRTYTVALSSGVDPLRSTGHTLRYRYLAVNGGMSLVVSLLQGATTRASANHNSIPPGAWIDGSLTLTAAQADAVTNYGNLRLRFSASYPSATASAVSQEGVPTSDVETGSWTRSDTGGTSNLYEMLDEGSPGSTADYIEYTKAPVGGVPATDTRYEARLTSLSDPIEHEASSHVLTVRAAMLVGATSGQEFTVRLLQGTATIASVATTWTLGEAGTQKTVTITLSSAQMAAISDYSDLRVECEWSSAYESYRIYYAFFACPEPRALRVSWAELEVPSTARGVVTWAEMRVPSSDTEYRGDVPTVYVGTNTNLYTAEDSGFTSVGSGYASGTLRPGGWYFTSWGEDVIATNYVDNVQIRRAGAGSFGTMITSTAVPKARFVATVRNFVALADINLTGHTADEVYWSAFEDETDFDPSITTLCDFQPLKSTQGQVMGIVGGEYAVVFKRNALHLMTWAGFPDVFRFDTTSRSVGTSAPRSIVTADGVIYFWDGSHFRRTTGYEEPQKIGTSLLERFLTDYEFSDEAIQAFAPADIREEDLAFSGAYDPHSGLLAWSYYGKDDPSPGRNARMVFYNPATDEWSFGKLDSGSLDISQIATWPNTLNEDTHPLKGLIGVAHTGTDRAWFKLAGATTYSATLRTKRLTLGDETNLSARIYGVVPIFEVRNSASLPANLTITASVANDPRFLTNVRQESYDTSKANEYQEFPHRLEGKWWQFEVQVPELSAQALTSFVGLYIDWSPGGEK